MESRSLLPLALAGAMLAPAAFGQGNVGVGDTPAFQFTNAYNTMGAKGSEDFRGKPVLIDFWGTR